MFAVVLLRHLEQIAFQIYRNESLRSAAAVLRREIDEGIQKYAITTDPHYGEIYAYETDGLGNYNLMDDANVPSLLSIPYLGYTNPKDPDGNVIRNTRKWVLSKKNPYYYEGKYAKGIGSPHTYRGHIWHIALIMQALTADSKEEILQMINMCEATDAGTDFMHESFHPDKPTQFSRSWFAWANSLFGELIRTKIHLL